MRLVYSYSITGLTWYGFTTRGPKVDLGMGTGTGWLDLVSARSSPVLEGSTSLFWDRNLRTMAFMMGLQHSHCSDHREVAMARGVMRTTQSALPQAKTSSHTAYLHLKHPERGSVTLDSSTRPRPSWRHSMHDRHADRQHAGEDRIWGAIQQRWRFTVHGKQLQY